MPPGILSRLAVLLETAERLAADGPAREWLGDVLREAAVPAGEEVGEEEEEVLRARLRARASSVLPEDGDLAVVEALPGFREGEVEAFLRLFSISVRQVETGEETGAPEGEGAVGDAGGRWPADAATRLLEEAYRRHGPERTRTDEEEADPAARARRRLERAGRNDPCPCGSGGKYKHCHWMDDLRRIR